MGEGETPGIAAHDGQVGEVVGSISGKTKKERLGQEGVKREFSGECGHDDEIEEG